MKHGSRLLVDTLVAVALVAALALLAPGGQGVLAAPGIIYVDADATGANAGTSWDDAFPTLQQALDVAGTGDQIWVAAGTYKPTAEYEGTGNRFKSFQMKNGVALYGGFDPDAGDVAWGHRDWVDNPTILSGDRGTAEDGLDDSYHVFYHPAGTVDGSAILDGFIITGGNAKAKGDASPHRSGGGMYNDSSSPTLNNVTFAGNSAGEGGGLFNGAGSAPALSNVAFQGNEAGRGGGMYNSTGTEPVLTNVAFEGNEAGSGGGMYNLESSPALSSVTFKGNSASSDGGGMHNESSSPALSSVTFVDNSAVSCGGGMCNAYSSPTLTNCTFSGNEAGRGGGMHNGYSSPTLTNCIFSRNSASWGGGMANMGSSPALTGCTFEGNEASGGYLGGGGGMHNESASPTLTNCTFMGNWAGYDGGGMANYRSSLPTLTGCTFMGNTAGRNGGGIHNHDSLGTLINCTLAGNSAGNWGGGMSNDEDSGSILTNCTFSGNSAADGGAMANLDFSAAILTNCILWGDTSPEICNLYNEFPYLYVTYSDIQGGWEGEGNIDLDPRFVDPDNGDFHLAQDSPCIDAGNNLAQNLPADDFEGDARILDGDGDGTAIVDMGVDEFVAGSALKEE